MKPASSFSPAAFWILLCAWLNCAGWGLSALHMLNPVGYLAAFTPFALFLLFCLRGQTTRLLPRVNTARWKWRAQHTLPCGFFILAALAIGGGFLHAPSNYDALAYRLPRVMHWLAAGEWHWIPTEFQRVNVRACGAEWTYAPLILLTRNYRWVFLTNVIPYLCLPGLIFSTLRLLGIRRRVAWQWMWLFPTGYGFLLQVGGAANDLAGTFFALAAVHFALRAGISRRFNDVAPSILASALLSGNKASNLPLLLPCLVATLPVVTLLLRHPLKSTALALVAIFSSLVPISVMNYKHCGDWSGLNAEYPQFHKSDPLLFLPTNAITLTIQNFVPPVFPVAGWWNSTIYKHAPAGYIHRIERTFDVGAPHFELPEMQNEESAGLGFSLSILLAVSVPASLAHRRTSSSRTWLQNALLAAPWLSLAALMLKSGVSPFARLVIPYYGLLLPLPLAMAGQEIVARKKWWLALAAVMLAIAVIPVIITPSRPLWPAQAILAKLRKSSAVFNRAYTVYTVYGQRHDAFAPVRTILPPDAKLLGMITYDDPEASLWLPFGSRRIEHVTGKESATDIRQRGIHYVLASAERTRFFFSQTPAEWAAAHDGDVIEKISLTLRAGTGPIEWDLIKLREQQP